MWLRVSSCSVACFCSAVARQLRGQAPWVLSGAIGASGTAAATTAALEGAVIASTLTGPVGWALVGARRDFREVWPRTFYNVQWLGCGVNEAHRIICIKRRLEIPQMGMGS
ncbi:hypothetical protein BJ170DRAFT_595380 [Xylariales sp. AK1849]|nr:hypothetical protein BJ170DRAFT_595380 [Xylariales sp. AK1849]